jgi:pSer/pThr/pTyr-binding forkhead associated (FHA) protein
MTTCPQCGGSVAEGVSFCQYCGTALKTAARGPICSDCGTRNPPGTNFCYTCGARVAAGAATSVVPLVKIASGSSPRLPGDDGRLITVRRDGTDGEAFAISGEQMDIGRSEGDLRFDDPHLAPRHARILRRAGQFVLTPLEARNGVYVRLGQAYELIDGDHFLLGKQVLRFELLSEAEKALRPAVEHGIVLFGTPVKAPWGRLRQLTAAGTSRDLYHLTRGELTLGREQGDIVFSDDEFLSRRHAQLQFRAGRVTLRDLGSSNGTYVRLRAQHALSPGEMIRMGDELLRFELG